MMPPLHQFPDGRLNQPGQIANYEPGVFPGDFYLARKRQVVATQDL
jgi:hypothetical protein